jgi:hypothetical protein
MMVKGVVLTTRREVNFSKSTSSKGRKELNSLISRHEEAAPSLLSGKRQLLTKSKRSISSIGPKRRKKPSKKKLILLWKGKKKRGKRVMNDPAS